MTDIARWSLSHFGADRRRFGDIPYVMADSLCRFKNEAQSFMYCTRKCVWLVGVDQLLKILCRSVQTHFSKSLESPAKQKTEILPSIPTSTPRPSSRSPPRYHQQIQHRHYSGAKRPSSRRVPESSPSSAVRRPRTSRASLLH